MSVKRSIILGIESSCDDTSAAILVGHKIASNCIANQKIHQKYGELLLTIEWIFTHNHTVSYHGVYYTKSGCHLEGGSTWKGDCRV